MITIVNKSCYNVALIDGIIGPKDSHIYYDEHFYQISIYSSFGTCIITRNNNKFEVKSTGKLHIKIHKDDSEKIIIY